jgi:hypothetical protein
MSPLLTQSGHPGHFGLRLLPSPTPKPVLYFYLNWPARITEVAPHFLAHGPASFLGKRYECLPRRACTLLERFEVGVKGRQREAMTFRGDLYVLKVRRLKE